MVEVANLANRGHAIERELANFARRHFYQRYVAFLREQLRRRAGRANRLRAATRRLIAGRGSEALATLFFFAVVACLFPFALGSDNVLLQKAAPGIIWIAALLAALLALEAVYARDFEDGTFDLLLMSPVSAAGVASGSTGPPDS